MIQYTSLFFLYLSFCSVLSVSMFGSSTIIVNMRISCCCMTHLWMDKVLQRLPDEVDCDGDGLPPNYYYYTIIIIIMSCVSYSTVCKPRSPRAADPPPAFSSSSLLGGGLSELDHLLQELNATQFNITGLCMCVCVCVCLNPCVLTLNLSLHTTLFLSSDEILAQFPSSKKDDRDKVKDKATTSTARYQN